MEPILLEDSIEIMKAILAGDHFAELTAKIQYWECLEQLHQLPRTNNKFKELIDDKFLKSIIDGSEE